jgi:hypothetical protein
LFRKPPSIRYCPEQVFIVRIGAPTPSAREIIEVPAEKPGGQVVAPETRNPSSRLEFAAVMLACHITKALRLDPIYVVTDGAAGDENAVHTPPVAPRFV